MNKPVGHMFCSFMYRKISEAVYKGEPSFSGEWTSLHSMCVYVFLTSGNAYTLSQSMSLDAPAQISSVKQNGQFLCTYPFLRGKTYFCFFSYKKLTQTELTEIEQSGTGMVEFKAGGDGNVKLSETLSLSVAMMKQIEGNKETQSFVNMLQGIYNTTIPSGLSSEETKAATWLKENRYVIAKDKSFYDMKEIFDSTAATIKKEKPLWSKRLARAIEKTIEMKAQPDDYPEGKMLSENSLVKLHLEKSTDFYTLSSGVFGDTIYKQIEDKNLNIKTISSSINLYNNKRNRNDQKELFQLIKNNKYKKACYLIHHFDPKPGSVLTLNVKSKPVYDISTPIPADFHKTLSILQSISKDRVTLTTLLSEFKKQLVDTQPGSQCKNFNKEVITLAMRKLLEQYKSQVNKLPNERSPLTVQVELTSETGAISQIAIYVPVEIFTPFNQLFYDKVTGIYNNAKNVEGDIDEDKIDFRSLSEFYEKIHAEHKQNIELYSFLFPNKKSAPPAIHLDDRELLHFALDIAGIIPGFGLPFDVINAALYIEEEDYYSAIFSGICAFPLIGITFAAGKLISKGTQAAIRAISSYGAEEAAEGLFIANKTQVIELVKRTHLNDATALKELADMHINVVKQGNTQSVKIFNELVNEGLLDQPEKMIQKFIEKYIVKGTGISSEVVEHNIKEILLSTKNTINAKHLMQTLKYTSSLGSDATETAIRITTYINRAKEIPGIALVVHGLARGGTAGGYIGAEFALRYADEMKFVKISKFESYAKGLRRRYDIVLKDGTRIECKSWEKFTSGNEKELLRQMEKDALLIEERRMKYVFEKKGEFQDVGSLHKEILRIINEGDLKQAAKNDLLKHFNDLEEFKKLFIIF